MTNEDIDARYRAGATLQRISADTGIPLSTVRSRLDRFGTPLRKRGKRKMDDEAAQKMLDAGSSQSAVARACGVTRQAISMAIRAQRLRPAQRAERTA